ncbi:MAG: AAA family ATPase [Deltaproteobacteria bacterium]|jgi:hypothetical protein|nr:AAA family ATPase [Deltaproteobacteria bacterium]
MSRELPTGIQDFEELRKKNAIYADKTGYLPILPTLGSIVFCARPSRFGKSLTVSTLDAFHSGRKELFKGLAAEKFMNSPKFTPKPVIRMDLSEAYERESLEDLNEALRSCLEVSATRHNISLRGERIAIVLSNLINDVREAASQEVVLLIDEYDTPVVSLIQSERLCEDLRLIERTRSITRSLYSIIKANDGSLDFVFITGVSKPSGVGALSNLNLVDISTNPAFASFMGFTQEELESCFSTRVKDAAKQLQMEEKELLRRFRDHYFGFSFDGTTMVYNPFSTLLFFENRKFGDYWIQSGSNENIRQLLQDKKFTAPSMSKIPVDMDFADSPGEIDATPPEGFLYQTGYLTLRKDDQGYYFLDYPNFEVRSTLASLSLGNLYASETLAVAATIEMGQNLAAGDIPKIIANIKRLYSGPTRLKRAGYGAQSALGRVLRAVAKIFGIAPQDRPKLNPAQNFREETRRRLGESFYVDALLTLLWAAKARASFLLTPAFRSCCRLKVRYGDQVYLIEFNAVRGADAAQMFAREGMAQIRRRAYEGWRQNPIIVSMAVDLEIRNLGACVFLKNGESAELSSQDLELLE